MMIPRSFRLRRIVGWGVADQGVLSIGNFLSLVLIARAIGISEFAAFSFGWLAIILCQNLQFALIISPAMIVRSRLPVSYRRSYDRAIWRQASVWGLLLAFIAIVAVCLWASLIERRSIPVGEFLAYFSALICMQLHEHCRRVFYLREEASMALVFDCCRILLLLSFCAIGFLQLRANALEAAYWAIACSAFIPLVLRAVAHSVAHEIRGKRRVQRYARIQHLRYGRWTGATALAEFGAINLPFYVAGIYLPLQELGQFRAHVTVIFAFAAVPRLIEGLGHVVFPPLVGRLVMRPSLSRLYVMLLVGLAVFCPIVVLMSFFGEAMMRRIFGPEFATGEGLMVVLSLSVYCLFGLSVFRAWFVSAGIPEAGTWARLFSFAIGVPITFALISYFGLVGAAWAMVFVELIGLLLSIHLGVRVVVAHSPVHRQSAT